MCGYSHCIRIEGRGNGENTCFENNSSIMFTCSHASANTGRMYHSNRNIYQTNSPGFEVGNGKNYLHLKNPLDFLVGYSDRRLGKQVTSFSRHRKTFVGKFGRIADPKIGRI